MKKLSIVSLALVLMLAMAGISFGATATGTLNVSATVVPTCSVLTTAVNFGAYDGSYVQTQGDITVTCAQDTPYNIALDAGMNYNVSNGGYRTMANGTNYLNYALWKSTGTEYWGDSDYADTFPATSLADTGNGAAQAHTVIAGIVPGQTVPTGSYTDVVNVTVYY
jgi:spore coat protein U-like protein